LRRITAVADACPSFADAFPSSADSAADTLRQVFFTRMAGSK
jgi:hypothetical protein